VERIEGMESVGEGDTVHSLHTLRPLHTIRMPTSEAQLPNAAPAVFRSP
jgi:hypothetical protein